MNFSQILAKNMNYNGYIYSVLLIFEPDKIYAISSSRQGITKVFDLNDNNNLIEIKNSNFNIYFLLYWRNSKNNKHNIIQCGRGKILISEFPNNETYHEFISEKEYLYNMGGIIFKFQGKDFLAVSATYGLIQICNLEHKQVFTKIKLNDVFLYSFVKWNDKYLLINDSKNNSILVFDMNKNNFEIKKKIECPDMKYERFIKKVEHPVYGESIISIGIEFKLKLYINEKE